MKGIRKYRLVVLGIGLMVGSLVFSGSKGSYAGPADRTDQTVDGVVLIDQSRALAGGVTTGDAPGFPVTISEPGSYRLSGNLIGEINIDTVVIAAGGVTFDLNGFSIQTGPGNSRGITDNGVVYSGIVIRNGAIRAHQSTKGIEMFSAQVEISRIQVFNGAFGIQTRGKGAILSGNIAAGGANGFVVSGESIVTGNIARGITSVGFSVGAGSLISGNSSSNNAIGISVSCPSNVIGNVATNNSSTNIAAFGGGCTLVNNNPAP
jgi:hypothetical protein